MKIMIRSYSELSKRKTFEDRFEYLVLRSSIGVSTFGFDRYLNQKFYTSAQWKRIRNHVIARDLGCDLGVEGYDIYDKIIIHHMNPMSVDDVKGENSDILDPEFLISTTHRTHNAIHFGETSIKSQLPIDRHKGDTKLW